MLRFVALKSRSFCRLIPNASAVRPQTHRHTFIYRYMYAKTQPRGLKLGVGA